MDEYLVNRVLTASPQQLHLMVVEGCLRHARAAAAAIADSDFERSHFALTDARRHLTHLISGLSPDADDEFLMNLRGLFNFAYLQMTTADLQHDAAALDKAIEILAEHRNTWLLVIDATTASGSGPEVSASGVKLSA